MKNTPRNHDGMYRHCYDTNNSLLATISLEVADRIDACRVKSLFGPKPHTKQDAVKAAGMGAPDNGKKPAVAAPVYEYDTEAVGTGVRGLEVE